MGYIEAIILGAVQGITEWLPISSEGVTLFLSVNFFETITLTEVGRLSLFLHLGTSLAALTYFRKEIGQLLKKFFNYRKESSESRALIRFYVLATFVSGIGFIIFKFLETLESIIEPQAKGLLIFLGLLLLVTGILQLVNKGSGQKTGEHSNMGDALWTGVAQGLAVIPGLSRSGLTVSALLLRGFEDDEALKLRFILSLPVVLAGNFLLDTVNFALTPEFFFALLFSFGFGLITIHGLLKLARKIQFGWFVLVFGFLVIGSAWI